MIIKCSTKNYLILLFFLLLLPSLSSLNSQTFNKFGIKGGFAISGLSTFNQQKPVSNNRTNLYIYDKSDFYNFFSPDIGVFAEWFNSEEFCLSTEIHYAVKGEKDKAVYTIPAPYNPNQTNDWENGELNDKAYYLSLQILPRYRVGISEKGEDNVYIFAGPAFNFLVSNKSSYSRSDYVKTKGFMGDFGGAIGIGFEVDRIYTCEIKLDYNFTGSYDLKYDNEKIARGYNSFSFLTGIALSEFFRK